MPTQDTRPDDTRTLNHDGPADDRTDTAPVPWTTVFPEGESPHDVAVDATHVYWGNYNDGKIRRIAKTGGEAETLASTSKLVPHDIALSETHVFFKDANDNILRVPKTGGPYEVLFAQQGAVGAFKISSGELFWAGTPRDGEPLGRVLSAPSTGKGQPKVLTQGHSGLAKIAVDAAFVFFTRFGDLEPAAGAVLRVAREGGATETLASAIDSPYAIWVDQENVYWAEGFHVRPVNNVWNGRIRSLPKNAAVGTIPVTLASNHAGGFDLVGDDKYLYWTTEFPASVVAVSKQGGTVFEFASRQAWPTALAIDNAFVYWCNFSLNVGGIMKGPKLP